MLTRGDLPNGRWLSQKIRILWYFETLPSIIGFPTLILFLTYVVAPLISDQKLDIGYQIAIVTLFIASLCVPYAIAELRYRKYIYALGNKDITIKRGVLEKVRYVVPYEKIQDVTVSRTPIENLLGIGTIHIETAGHKADDGEILLPGIENYNELVNEIVEQIKKIKESGDPDSETHHKKMIDLLSEINDKMEKLIKPQKTEEKIEIESKKTGKSKVVKDYPLLGE